MWKLIKFENIEKIYEITEHGVIRNTITGKISKGSTKSDGYILVKLKTTDGKKTILCS